MRTTIDIRGHWATRRPEALNSPLRIEIGGETWT